MEPASAMLIGGGINAASSIAGGLINRMFDDNDKQWERNYNAQKEFAQNSIQWRVQDAEKAGIHPLYAIGGQMPGYTPSSAFSNDSMGEAIAQAGNAFGNAMGQIGLINARLQNEKLETEIAKEKAELMQNLGALAGKPDVFKSQKSDTIPHITKQADNTLFLSGLGHSRNLPDQLESEVASLPADLAKVWDTQYSRATHERLPEIKGKKKVIMLSPLGYSSKYVDEKEPLKDMSVSDIFTNGIDSVVQGLGKAARFLLDEFYNLGRKK